MSTSEDQQGHDGGGGGGGLFRKPSGDRKRSRAPDPVSGCEVPFVPVTTSTLSRFKQLSTRRHAPRTTSSPCLPPVSAATHPQVSATTVGGSGVGRTASPAPPLSAPQLPPLPPLPQLPTPLVPTAVASAGANEPPGSAATAVSAFEFPPPMSKAPSATGTPERKTGFR